MLALEFFAEGSPDCPLILLHGRDAQVVRDLAAALENLVEDLPLERFPGIKSVENCRVVARVTKGDLGLRAIGPSSFAWELSPGGWAQVAGLLQPFASASAGDSFQLLELKRHGRISFIISGDRHW
jgi:hypothetical protein